MCWTLLNSEYDSQNDRFLHSIVTGEWMNTLVRYTIILNCKIHHFNSFWSSFSIFVNGLYSFKANLTLFSTLSGHLLFSFYVCILKRNFQEKNDNLTYFSLKMLKKLQILLPRYTLQCCMNFNTLRWEWIELMYQF